MLVRLFLAIDLYLNLEKENIVKHVMSYDFERKQKTEGVFIGEEVVCL